jgi:hypothetical protein
LAKPPEEGSFEFWAAVEWVGTNPLMATFVGGLFVSLVSYIFNRAAGQREEMKQLRGALDTAIRELGARDQATVDRLLDTVDKLADALRPSARLAVAPVGESARTLTIGGATEGRPSIVIGEAEKAAILSTSELEVGAEKPYHLVITELDMVSGNCHVAFVDDPDARVPGRITDPAFGVPNNLYALAMAAQRPITVRAKATLKDGEIERLHISDTVGA